MASPVFSPGAIFCVVIPAEALDMIARGCDAVAALPEILRRAMENILRRQSLRPFPTYVGAVSTVFLSELHVFVFVGSDCADFASPAGCGTVALLLQDYVRALAFQCASLEEQHKAGLITVNWEANLFS